MAVNVQNYKKLTGKGTGEAKEYTVAEITDSPQDNLLTNSDFRYGVINQQGKSSYNTLNEYTIDMWKLVRGTLTVGSGFITINGEIMQNAYNASGQHLFAIYVASGSGSIKFDGVSTTKTLTTGLNIVSVNGTITGVHIVGTSLKVNYCKLEKGSYFTGMPPWNRISELEKCKERFLFVPVIFNGYVDENGKIFIACEDSRKLIKQPSLVIDANTQIVLYYDDGNGTYLLENIKEGRYATKDGYICLGTLTSYKNWRISGFYKSGKIFLNSYEYGEGVQ